MRAACAALVALFLAGCTAGGLESLEVSNPSFASPTDVAADADTEAAGTPLTVEQQAEIDTATFVPAAKPGNGATTGEVPEAAETQSKPLIDLASKPADAAAPAQSAPVAEPVAATPIPAPRDAAAQTEPAAAEAPVVANSFAPPPQAPKKKGFLAGFFSQTPQDAPVMSNPAPAKPKPVIQLASIDPAEKTAARASLGSEPLDVLPGVRQSSLFEIKRRDSLDDDSDVDVHEDEESPVQYASAAGMARLAPNGLIKQRDSVDVACLKPSLVRMLKQVERRFGKRVVVTSGYRSPEYNKRVRGARKSMHMYCAAADVQLDGVSKWDLANYVRSMPGRGGVGTYCHTNSVHIDVGPERDWNWRCRRRKG
jgi:uncharacterized protein YcbK (DUF882 family)